MVSDADKKIIQEIAGKFHAQRVILLDSSLYSDRESRDIAIGVEGVPEKEFFAFYGELMCALSKAVGVVDLSTRSRFVELIKREGELLAVFS